MGQARKDAAIERDFLRLNQAQLGREGLDHHPVVVEQPEAVRGRDHVGGLEPNDAKPHVRQSRQRHQPIKLPEHDLWWAEPVAKGRFGQHEVKSLVRPVQNVLTLHTSGHCFVNVVAHLEHTDALGEAVAGILGRLEETWNERGLEGPE